VSEIACNLDALSKQEQSRRSALAVAVRGGVARINETTFGYRLQLPGDPEFCRDLVDLVLLERRCCPFLEMTVHFEPEGGPVYLDVGGPSGVKKFLADTGVLGCGDAGSC
jgi:hypothetical protein